MQPGERLDRARSTKQVVALALEQRDGDVDVLAVVRRDVDVLALGVHELAANGHLFQLRQGREVPTVDHVVDLLVRHPIQLIVPVCVSAIE